MVLNENTLATASSLHSSCVLKSLIEASNFIGNGEFGWAIALLRSAKTQKRECPCCYCVAAADFDVEPVELCIYERQFFEMLCNGAQEPQTLLTSIIKHLASPRRYATVYAQIYPLANLMFTCPRMCANFMNTRLAELGQMLVVSKMLNPEWESQIVPEESSRNDNAPEILKHYWSRVFLNNVWLRSRADLIQYALDRFSSSSVSIHL
jgi:hypothetical protein